LSLVGLFKNYQPRTALSPEIDFWKDDVSFWMSSFSRAVTCSFKKGLPYLMSMRLSRHISKMDSTKGCQRWVESSEWIPWILNWIMNDWHTVDGRNPAPIPGGAGFQPSTVPHTFQGAFSFVVHRRAGVDVSLL